METDENDEIEIKIEYDDQEIFEPNNEALIQQEMETEKNERIKDIKTDCEICGKKFATNQNLKRHISTIHTIQPTFSNSKEHKCKCQNYTKPPPVKCDNCLKVFSFLTLGRHTCLTNSLKSDNENIIKAQCLKCNENLQTERKPQKTIYIKGAKYAGLKLKKKHWMTIQKENPTILKCDLCEETFSNKEQIQIHKVNIHGKSKFNRKNRSNTWKCYRCNQKFSTKNLMLEHTQIEHKILKSQRVKKKPQKLIDLMPGRQKSQENKNSNEYIRKYYSYEKREEMKKIEGVTVSVTKIKPPYCVSCDKYYCSEKELQNHINYKHVKGYIEFMTFIVKKVFFLELETFA